MIVFTEERVAVMRGVLERSLATTRMFQNARFSAELRASQDETLVITIGGGDGSVTTTDDPGTSPDFTVGGPSEAWEGFFSGDGLVQHGSVLGMVQAGPISDGVLTSELAAEGDLIRLYANWPVIDRLLEAAARSPRSTS